MCYAMYLIERSMDRFNPNPDLNRSQFFLSFLFLENILILLSDKFNYVFDRALLM